MAASVTQMICRQCVLRSLKASQSFQSYYRKISNEASVLVPLDNEVSESTDEVSRDITRLKPALQKRIKGLAPDLPTSSPYVVFTRKSHVQQQAKKTNFYRDSYAKYGRKASGIDIRFLWPTAEEIQRENAKLDFFKPVEERIKDLRAEKQAEKEEIEAHQKKICDNMAKMDQYLEQYQQRKKKRLQIDEVQVQRREELLKEARDFFGYDVSAKDLKFQQMVEWKEEQEKIAKKKKKKQKKENYALGLNYSGA